MRIKLISPKCTMRPMDSAWLNKPPLVGLDGSNPASEAALWDRPGSC